MRTRSGQTDLTDNLHSDFDPAWSPDGTKKIVFASDRNGDPDIYVMKADGTGPRTRLTNSPAEEYNPEWSPDGKRILFVRGSFSTDNPTEIYRMRADGSHKKLGSQETQQMIFLRLGLLTVPR